MKAIKIILFVLLCIVLIAAVFFVIIPMTETRSNIEIEGSQNWMAEIPDEQSLEEIYIPGTHDSASKNAQLGYFSKCQSSDIYTQLNDGYRYLDIRLGVRETKDGTVLTLYHGFCKCQKGPWPWSALLDLDDVLSSCYTFLEENPTETVVFAVKMEQGKDEVQFQKLLHEYIDKTPDKWFLSDTIPALGECRGKLVLMRRYEDANNLGRSAGIQLFWEDQGGNDDVSLSVAREEQDNYLLLVQDRYKYSAEDKWNAFKASLKSSSASEKHLLLTFLSTNGTPAYGHPYSYARDLNKRFLAEDFTVFTDPFWAVVDFSDALMAQKIYKLNYQP